MAEYADIYLDMRQMILDLPPSEISVQWPEELSTVRAALMELGLSGGVATLVCLADGTTSLYFSNGGGTLGLGAKLPVANAARSFLTAAEGKAESLDHEGMGELPEEGEVGIQILTVDGWRSARDSEREVQATGHPLHALYAAGQGVITQIRLNTPSQK